MYTKDGNETYSNSLYKCIGLFLVFIFITYAAYQMDGYGKIKSELID